MTTKLEQHRIDHIKLGLNFFGYDTSDFGVINNQLYIKDTGINHLNIQNVGTNTHDEIDSHIENISNPHSVLANQVNLSFLSNAIYKSVQSMNDIYHSTGWVSGGTISNAGGESVDVVSGSGYIRATDNSLTTLVSFDWPASSGISIPTDTTRFIGIEYNSGSPQVIVKTTDSWDYNTEFPIGTVININGNLHIEDSQHAIGNHASLMIQRLYGVQGIQRDRKVGGLIVSETGTRNLILSAGKLWDKLNDYTISALDTSGTGTFETYYSDGAGGWTETTGLTQWPNTQYDDGSGTLATLSANRYGVLWIFVETDGDLSILYGTAQYNTLAQAEASTIPSFIPDILIYHGFLVARLIFQESASSATSIESSFSTFFSGSSVTDHGSLAGLTDSDDHTQYLLLAGRSGGQTLIGGTASGDDLTLQSTSHATKGSILFGTSAYDEVNNRLLIGTTTGSSYGQLVIENSGLPAILLRNTDASYTDDDVGLASYQDQFIIQNRDADGSFSATPFKLNINAPTDSFVIDSAGKIGIGTSTPSDTLEVIGDVGIYGSSTDDEGIALQTAYSDGNSSGRMFFRENDNNLYGFSLLYAGASDPTIGGTSFTLTGNHLHILNHNNSEAGNAAMSISRAGGNVGIGVTPSYRLDVKDSVGSYVSRFFNDGNNTNRWGIGVQAGTDTPASNSDCRWIDFLDGNATVLSYIGYSTSSPYAAFYSISDARLKENIRDTKITALDKINALTLKSFDWKPDENGKRKQSQDFSFIAQDVQKIIPECIAKDENGYLSITEAPLIKYLVKSIQELNQIIKSQQKQIDKLKSKP